MRRASSKLGAFLRNTHVAAIPTSPLPKKTFSLASAPSRRRFESAATTATAHQLVTVELISDTM